MPLPFLAQLGIGAGVTGLNYILGRRKNPMVNPSDYRKELVFDANDAAGMRSRIRNETGASMAANLAGTQSATQANITQAGAAGRLPAGAVLSNLAGANYNTARGFSEGMTGQMAELEPRLEQMQQGSLLDFLGMQNQYNAGQEETGAYNRNLIGDTIGTLGKLAVLYNSGFFGSKGGGEKWNDADYASKGFGVKLRR